MLPIVILATGDPSKTGSTAEAIRIAAALAGWGQLEVTLCLHGAATNILVDPPNPALERQIQSVSDVAGPILLNQPEFSKANAYSTRLMTDPELSRRLADAQYVLRF